MFKIQNIIYVITIILLIIIAYIDFKKHIISDKFNIAIGVLGIINVIYDIENLKIYLISTCLVFIFFLILAITTKGGIGGGDIKLFTALSLIFGTNILTVITITFTVATIFSMLKLFLKQMSVKENVPLAPFVCLSVIMVVIIKL